MLSLEEVKNRIKQIHGDVVVLDEETYVNTNIKCRFIDKDYGPWWVFPKNILYNRQGHWSRRSEKTKQTCLEKYGVDTVLNTKEIRKKALKNWVLTIDEVKQRIKDIHGDVIVLDEKTYTDTRHKARFIDKDYGAWWAMPQSILHQESSHSKRAYENRKQTSLEKYGVDSPNKNRDVALKQSKSANNSYIVNHWKDGREIVCRASWEHKTALQFNEQKEDFEKDVRFEMPNGKVYFVDFWLPNRNLYVEVKGWFRKDAKEKWDWFHKEHPNSELWDYKKLKELKIL